MGGWELGIRDKGTRGQGDKGTRDMVIRYKENRYLVLTALRDRLTEMLFLFSWLPDHLIS